MTKGISCFLMVVAGLTPLPVQAQTSATLPLPDGRVVEVIGLRRWTLEMIQDSLARHANGVSLESHACAVALRYTLGFADASATRYPEPGKPLRIVVAVREPQDSARVKYRPAPLDTAVSRPEWAPVVSLMRTRPSVFWIAVGLHAAHPQQVRLEYGVGEDSVRAVAAAAFLRAANRETDRAAAQRTLREGRNVTERAVAALILLNFPERDDTYWALVSTLRESDGIAKSAAAQVLNRLAIASPRQVDWEPATADIHAILDGTSLFTLRQLSIVLSRTGAGPAQARAFLAGGGEMLLAFAASDTRSISQPARELLIKLRGTDLGDSPAAWQAWVRSL